VEALREFTYRELRAGIDGDFIHADQHMRELKRGTRYKGTKGTTVTFETFSSEFDKNNVIWTQSIKLMDLKDALKMTDLKLSDRVKLAMAGDIGVRCDCPAFQYWGYAWILTQLDAINPPPEDRKPNIRNPGSRGTVCKHLALVFSVFGNHWNSVTKDLKAQGLV
jgi:hypothetical protein